MKIVLLATGAEVLGQCNPYQGAAGVACECTSRGGCDTVEVPALAAGGSYAVLSQAGQAPWQPLEGNNFIPGKQPDYSDPDGTITVTLGKQTFIKIK